MEFYYRMDNETTLSIYQLMFTMSLTIFGWLASQALVPMWWSNEGLRIKQS